MALEAIDTGLRRVTFLELLEAGGWRCKLYGMGLAAAAPSVALGPAAEVPGAPVSAAPTAPVPTAPVPTQPVPTALMSQQLIEHAKELIAATLPRPARTDTRLGVGFATVHAGEHGDYVLIDWWESGDLLKHHLFGAPHPHDGQLQYGWPQNVMGCIWEMAIPWFERNAWYRHVLSQREPHLEAYLAEHMEGTV